MATVPELLRQFLKENKATQVLPASWSLLYVHSTDTVGSAFQKMAEKNVYAVPVFDQATNRFTAFLGLSDILHRVVHLFVAKARLAHPDLASDVPRLLAQATFCQADAENIHRKVFHYPLTELINLSGRNPWRVIPNSISLQEAIDILVNEKLPRAPLADSEGRITAILSQATIVRYLAGHLDKFGGLENATLSAVAQGSPLVAPSDTEERAIVCFAKLDINEATHLPLESSGKPAGNLSVKDIKAAGQFERLIQPVGEYVAFIRQQNVKAVHPYIHINTTDTLGKAFRRFAATGVHMMFLTDMPQEELEKASTYPPVALLTLQNLLAPLASN